MQHEILHNVFVAVQVSLIRVTLTDAVKTCVTDNHCFVPRPLRPSQNKSKKQTNSRALCIYVPSLVFPSSQTRCDMRLRYRQLILWLLRTVSGLLQYFSLQRNSYLEYKKDKDANPTRGLGQRTPLSYKEKDVRNVTLQNSSLVIFDSQWSSPLSFLVVPSPQPPHPPPIYFGTQVWKTLWYGWADWALSSSPSA